LSKVAQGVSGIDLVLIDQQSVGKRSLHLVDTVNAKKKRPFTGVLTIFDREPNIAHPAKEQASFLKINDINDIIFWNV
jgi:hypothetical protein